MAKSSKILPIGNNYQLYIGAVRNQKTKTEIGIRLKTGTFDGKSNYVAVLVEDEMLRVIIRDLQDRLEPAH